MKLIKIWVNPNCIEKRSQTKQKLVRTPSKPVKQKNCAKATKVRCYPEKNPLDSSKTGRDTAKRQEINPTSLASLVKMQVRRERGRNRRQRDSNAIASAAGQLAADPTPIQSTVFVGISYPPTTFIPSSRFSFLPFVLFCRRSANVFYIAWMWQVVVATSPIKPRQTRSSSRIQKLR